MIILLLIGTFVGLLLLGMPISFAVGIASAVGTLVLFDVDNATIVQRMLTGINNFPLLAVIFFIFTGQLMARGGVATRLVRLSEVLVGRLPGGLAQINVVSSMFFGGVSGSAVADVASFGPMLIPAMVKDGYTKAYATAITLTSAIMGPIIPPSIAMIVYAHVVGSVSVAGLLLAGIVPGILVGVSLMIVAFVHGLLYHRRPSPVIPWREKIWRLFDGMLGVITMFIILGGITTGVFTATEAGAIAAVYALFLTMVVYREVSWRDLPEILWEGCITNAVVMFLIATCSAFTWILTYERLPTLLSQYLFQWIESKELFLLLVNLLLLFVGMFIDMTPAIIMIVPMLLPIATKFGIDPIHLGIVVVVNLAYGLITPPVGTSLFVGMKIANIRIEELIGPMLPQLGAMLVVLMLVTYFPALFMWVPAAFGFANL
jgi:tripartite ATP-independent transporter DctM subunit